MMTKEEFKSLMDGFVRLSDRELFVLGTAYLEDIMTDLLGKRLIGRNIFAKKGISDKVDLAYAVGILHQIVHGLLKDIIFIRNKFTHRPEVNTLADATVAQKLDNVLRVFNPHLDNVVEGLAPEPLSTRQRAELVMGILIKELSKISVSKITSLQDRP